MKHIRKQEDPRIKVEDDLKGMLPSSFTQPSSQRPSNIPNHYALQHSNFTLSNMKRHASQHSRAHITDQKTPYRNKNPTQNTTRTPPTEPPKNFSALILTLYFLFSK